MSEPKLCSYCFSFNNREVELKRLFFPSLKQQATLISIQNKAMIEALGERLGGGSGEAAVQRAKMELDKIDFKPVEAPVMEFEAGDIQPKVRIYLYECPKCHSIFPFNE